MENIKKLILCVLMLSLVSTAAVADIHYVNPGESIQAAIDAADPGDEIEVAPGTYTEAINFIGKAVRLYSTGGPDVTIIDGTGHSRVVLCTNSEGPGTVLEGFTIMGGYNGGGMLNDSSSPTVTNCTFTSNTGDYGAGMYNYSSNPTLTDCTFSSNTANYGGGMSNIYYSNPTVTNCTFTDNTAICGGGMYNDYHSNPMVTNCTFSTNTADYGGGMFNGGNTSPTVTNCTFTGNTADYGGGMCHSPKASPTVTNCTFTGNNARYGGGMYNYNNSDTTVTNCTFIGNTATEHGGGMCSYFLSNPTVTNCILWDDSPDEIFDDNSSMTVTYSDVQGGWPGTGNLDADPLFADADGRLSPGSPCIDAGNDAAVPPGVTTDLDGNLRIQGVCVDMGAFESDFIVIDFSGWVWVEESSDYGYSLNENDLVYFVSFGPVWNYNFTTGEWAEEGTMGWIFVDWPFFYDLAKKSLMFALPPESGLWVFHFSIGQWELLPRIIP